MSIIKCKDTANFISNWIKDYVTKAGLKTLVVGLSGGVDSALVALLCKKTNLPLVCVNMPCHSSDSARQRARAFAMDYDLSFKVVSLDNAYDSISSEIEDSLSKNDQKFIDSKSKVANGGLRSGLRAPVLGFFANASHGLIVGTGNRSEDNLTRYFQKIGDGCVDIAPIADLFKSEVYELFAYLAQEFRPTRNHEENSKGKLSTHKNFMGDISGIPQSALDILYAAPTADLWGPDAGQEDEKELGMSYDDVEWADRENSRTGIVVSTDDPAKHPAWLGYTGHQRMVICKVHAMEKATRHKHNPALPVCVVRLQEGLVR